MIKKMQLLGLMLVLGVSGQVRGSLLFDPLISMAQSAFSSAKSFILHSPVVPIPLTSTNATIAQTAKVAGGTLGAGLVYRYVLSDTAKRWTRGIAGLAGVTALCLGCIYKNELKEFMQNYMASKDDLKKAEANLKADIEASTQRLSVQIQGATASANAGTHAAQQAQRSANAAAIAAGKAAASVEELRSSNREHHQQTHGILGQHGTAISAAQTAANTAASKADAAASAAGRAETGVGTANASLQAQGKVLTEVQQQLQQQSQHQQQHGQQLQQQTVQLSTLQQGQQQLQKQLEGGQQQQTAQFNNLTEEQKRQAALLEQHQQVLGRVVNAISTGYTGIQGQIGALGRQVGTAVNGIGVLLTRTAPTTDTGTASTRPPHNPEGGAAFGAQARHPIPGVGRGRGR